MDGIQRGVITLLHSAVTGQSYSLPEDFSLEQAYGILKSQRLVTLAYIGALQCGIPDTTQTMQSMMELYYKYLIRNECQMKAVEELFQAFEEQGIAHLPFKGCVLKALYPKPELRIMGDVDILIRLDQKEQAEAIMKSLKYTQKTDDEHVSFWSSDALAVELHKCLVPPMDKEFYAYYGSGWHLAVKKTETRYDLSCEDMFVFLIVHLARHYRFSGIGCKHILDLYLYRKANPDMDERHIRNELKKLYLLEFYNNILRLLEVWFEGKEEDPITNMITDHVFSGGSFGNLKNYFVFSEVKKNRKNGELKNRRIKLLWDAIFPPVEIIGKKYPVLYRWPILLPLIWVVRWSDVLIHRRQNIGIRAKGIRVVRDETVSEYERALRFVGLDFFEENQERTVPDGKTQKTMAEK